MDVLSVIHGDDARTELFAPAIAEGGHRLDEWSFSWGTPPPRPLESYDAVLVFGGAMHADHDDSHPWLLPETRWLEELIASGTPVLGICLGV
jgi:GMP synthase (glutamine-hydrolysing)